MIKETKKTKEVDVKQVFCDICGKETFQHKECCMCHKDLCKDHIAVRIWDGDYSDCYCKSCWDIGDYYRKEIERLENKISELHDEWKKKCSS
ncbi:MAG: hypothetical protein WC466_08620 [Candidatus Izemoplasmatales bacterium]